MPPLLQTDEEISRSNAPASEAAAAAAAAAVETPVGP